MPDYQRLVHALDFSSWKRDMVRDLFAPARVNFVDRAAVVPPGGTLVVWGRREPLAIPDGVRVIHLEDGFLRSVGLGADLIRPISWVMDERGIYYDATRPSDLEVLLETRAFTDEELARAARFRAALVAANLTKYNVGAERWERPATARRVILVPGQVESDASIRYGAPGVKTNLELLRAVRMANPDAYVLYKPHPDVIAGLRDAGSGESNAGSHCDAVAGDVAMGALLGQVDEVHALTSLAGFEALLRGKPVTCHGQPFYAGWGLTRDLVATPRRTRRLTLDELVAGALLLYPAYVSRESGAPITPEEALDELVRWRSRAGEGVAWWRKVFRHVLRVVVRRR